MPVNKAAVAELVAYGIPDSQIGDAMGVTSQYIANLRREDEEVQELVQEKATDIAVRQHNNKVTEEVIEESLLQKIKEQVDMSDSLIESVKSLQLLKDIQGKTRANGHGAQQELPATINLNLGQTAEVTIQRTGTNEIIKIAGRDMAPMPAGKVIEAARERTNGKTRPTETAGEDSPPDEHSAAERISRSAAYSRLDSEPSTDSL